MIKLISILILASTSMVLHAYEEPSYKDFFKIEENQSKFKILAKSGKLKEVRTQLVSICKSWNMSEKDIDKKCKCAKKAFKKINDKELFYTSILAFGRYQAKVKALENKDGILFEQLKVQFKDAPLAPAEIEEKCS